MDRKTMAENMIKALKDLRNTDCYLEGAGVCSNCPLDKVCIKLLDVSTLLEIESDRCKA